MTESAMAAELRGMHLGRHRRRTAVVGMVSVICVAALAGCSDDGVTADGATVITVAAGGGAAERSTPVTEVAPVTAATDVAVEPTAVTAPIDAPALLQQALDAVAGGYHFRTAVSLDGIEVLVAEGDRVGDGTRLTIWTSGTSLSYVITPAASWVVPDGGEWEVLDTAPATTDPLLALRSPSAVSGVSPDGSVATLVATVSAAALGMPADGPADVRVIVNGSTLQEVQYQALLDGRTADVATVFGPVVDPTPVTPPV